jgi:hypothetical protein
MDGGKRRPLAPRPPARRPPTSAHSLRRLSRTYSNYAGKSDSSDHLREGWLIRGSSVSEQFGFLMHADRSRIYRLASIVFDPRYM